MKIALEVWSSSYEQTEETCLLAEEIGFDAFYYGESPHDLNLDCWATLAALARTTERIRLGPVIANILPTYRSTTLLARQAMTVDAISGGRIDLRTGVGADSGPARRWWEPFGVDYPPYDERLSDLERALAVLPQLCAGKPIDAPAVDIELALPLTLAATGERAMRLAAHGADVWETSFCTPDEFAERNRRFSQLAGAREIYRSLEIDGFVAPTEAGLSDLLERVRGERGGEEDLDPVFDRALLGTPDAIAVRLGELVEAGVDQVVVALHDPHDRDALQALASGVTLSDAQQDDGTN